MLSGLMKNLSKKDAVQLMEIAYRTLKGTTEEDIKSVVTEFKKGFYFDSAFLCNLTVTNKNVKPILHSDPIFSFKTFDLPNEFSSQYLQQRFISIDPVAEAFLNTRELVDYQELVRKNPSILKNPAHQLTIDFNLFNVFSYGTFSLNAKEISGFSLYYKSRKLKANPRIITILKFITPFMTELYEKTLGLSKRPLISPITRKEYEVLKWLKEGKTSWEISMILNIGESTVNFHVTNIMRKLNATKRTQAVAVAIQNKLIEF